MTTQITTYDAALERAALFDLKSHGRLLLRDRDRAALLHRLSTNHIERLTPGQGTQTVLTTPIGRIIDLLTVYALPDDSDPRLLVVTGDGQGPAIFKHIRKNIFFNDKLKLADASESLAQWYLCGPEALRILSDLGVDAAALDEFGVMAAEIAGVAGFVARAKSIGGAGFHLFFPNSAEIAATLSKTGVETLDRNTYDILRIEAGYGAVGNELSSEYIPLETGLWDAISFNKGCYVGQEIIARMESRNRLAKQLRGLRLPAAAANLPLPSTLRVAGKDAGDLTSVAVSPRFGLIGLAYVRSAHAEPGTLVTIGESDAVAEVVSLPFANPR